MKLMAVSGIMLTLLLIGMLIVTFEIQPAKGFETIYIRADGSVDPPTANITTVDKVTYTFTGNNYDSIVVERDNIVIDGGGYTLQGTGSGDGIAVMRDGPYYVSNITVKNTVIKAFSNGIYVSGASVNTLSGNNITANSNSGAYLDSSFYNSISGNNITANSNSGARFMYSCYNSITGNSITNNGAGLSIWMNSDYNIVSGNSLTNNDKGIFFNSAPANNVVSGNNITSNGSGVYFSFWSDNNSITGNNITSNGSGVYIDLESYYNVVSGNNITNNNYGVYLASSRNSISGNSITNNGAGVYVEAGSDYTTVSGNTIKNNNDAGIYLGASNANVIANNVTNNNYGIRLVGNSNKLYHNNFVDNTQVYAHYLFVNVWDDGFPSGGNYWSDYPGFDLHSGPDQDQLGSDGIGDTSYFINDNNIDHYPLISPFPQVPDFDITVFPPAGTAVRGTTVTTYVYVSAIAGYYYPVSLSASGQPEGVTIDFNPNTGTPYFTSTMTIQVGDSVPFNTYPITVTGLGSDGTTHSTTYTLTVVSEIPEFPFGAEAATAIGLIVAIVYVWMRRRWLKISDTART